MSTAGRRTETQQGRQAKGRPQSERTVLRKVHRDVQPALIAAERHADKHAGAHARHQLQEHVVRLDRHPLVVGAVALAAGERLRQREGELLLHRAGDGAEVRGQLALDHAVVQVAAQQQVDARVRPVQVVDVGAGRVGDAPGEGVELVEGGEREDNEVGVVADEAVSAVLELSGARG